MADFPFSNWKNYFEAFNESLNTEFFADKYPLYSLELDNSTGDDVDKAIVNDLLNNGLSPQEGLDRIIYAVIHGDRYANDCKEFVI